MAYKKYKRVDESGNVCTPTTLTSLVVDEVTGTSISDVSGLLKVLDITDGSIDFNTICSEGTYKITGERTNASDGLPILNSNPGHTVDGILKVLDSSISGSGQPTDKVVTQILTMSNRIGGDGHIWVRTGQGVNKSSLTWSTWEKLQGVFEKNAVYNLDDIDGYTTNGVYSGLYANTEPSTHGDISFSPGDTFLMIVINGYAATPFGTPQITQLLYKLPAKALNLPQQNAEIYLRIGSYNKTDKVWDWGNFTKMVTNADLSSQVATLTAKIDTNASNIASATITASEALTAANNAQSTADAAQTKNSELQLRVGELSDLDTIEKTSIVNAINEVKKSSEEIKEYKLLHSHTFTEDATSPYYELLTADDGTPIHQYKDILIFAELSYVKGGSNMSIFINKDKWPEGFIGTIAKETYTTNYVFKLKIDGLNTTLYSECRTNSFANHQYSDGNEGINFIGFSSISNVFTYDRLTIKFPFKANNKILIYGR